MSAFENNETSTADGGVAEAPVSQPESPSAGRMVKKRYQVGVHVDSGRVETLEDIAIRFGRWPQEASQLRDLNMERGLIKDDGTTIVIPATIHPDGETFNGRTRVGDLLNVPKGWELGMVNPGAGPSEEDTLRARLAEIEAAKAEQQG